MLRPTVTPPFPLAWGFTTRQTPADQLPDIRLTQIHGCLVHPAHPGPCERMEGDGLWTQDPGVTLGIRVADCVPVLLAGITGEGPWIATLHAGWKGAVAGILRQGVEIFQRCGGQPEDLFWALGPCIGPCHFEVGPEVVATARLDPTWHEDMARPGTGDRHFLDLHALLRAQALGLGLTREHDGSVARCTRCEPDTFYSYRGGDLQDRQWGVARILPGWS